VVSEQLHLASSQNLQQRVSGVSLELRPLQELETLVLSEMSEVALLRPEPVQELSLPEYMSTQNLFLRSREVYFRFDQSVEMETTKQAGDRI
jgi:hypothetical protein